MDALQPRINIRECPTVKCEKCGSIYFKEALYLKWVSKLQGAAQDQPVPFPVYMCIKCDHVNEGYNPFEEPKKSDTIVLNSDEDISDAVDSFINE